MITKSPPLKLLVADESNLIRSIFSSLPSQDVTVSHLARSRQELVSHLEGRREPRELDAVLCDFNISGPQGGIEVMAQLRERELLKPETAFLLMSDDNRMSALRAGVYSKPDAIILKPFKISTLMDKLGRTVGARRQLSELSTLAKNEEWRGLLQKAELRIEQPGPVPEQVYKFKAQALTKMGARDQLIQLYSGLLKENEALMWVHEDWARLDYEAGFIAESAERLKKLVGLFPAHVEAHRTLADIQHDFGNFRGMQLHLEDAAKHATQDASVHRELGHAALFNADLIVASRAYLTVIRLGVEAGNLQLADVVNLVRVYLLQDESEQAYRQLVEVRELHRHNVVLVVLDYFIRASFYRKNASPGVYQRQVRDGLQVLDEAAQEGGLPLRLAAVESCLMAGLSREALARSTQLVAETRSNNGVHSALRLWAVQLNNWAKQLNEDELSRGFLHYRQKIK